MPRFSSATVYNALATLAKQGDVLVLSFGDGTNRYGQNDRHHHALSLGCGRLEGGESRMPETSQRWQRTSSAQDWCQEQ